MGFYYRFANYIRCFEDILPAVELDLACLLNHTFREAANPGQHELAIMGLQVPCIAIENAEERAA